MPVELNIVESTTALDTTVVEVILESASEPGPAGPGVPTGGTAGQVLTKDSGTDFDTSWQDSAGGGGGAPDDVDYLVGTASGDLSAEIVVGTVPGGELGGTWASPTVDATHSGSSHAGVQAAAEATAAGALATHAADTTGVHGITDTAALALAADVQPLDSDLTAIASLTTTAFGRSLLELANQAALLSAAGAAAASHAHSGADITSGTVAEARIHADIARDSEVTSAISALSSVYQPLDSDLTAIAALTTTAFGRSLLAMADAAAVRAALDLEAGTDFPSLATFNDHSARHEDGGGDEISLAGLSGEPADTVNKSLYDANTVLAANSDNTPAAVTMAASTILARLAAGNIKAASVAEILTLLDVPTNAQAILDALMDAKGDLIVASAADTPARLAVGTNGHVLTADSAESTGVKWAAAAGGGGLHDAYAYLRDEKTANTDGGTATSGSWQTRPINTEVFDPDGIVSVSSNQMTLGAGVYYVRAKAPFFRTGDCRLRLQDITNTATLALGSNAYNNNAANDGTHAHLAGRFTLAGSTVVELQYRTEFTSNTTGLGTLTNWSVVEIYAEIEFWREA